MKKFVRIAAQGDILIIRSEFEMNDDLVEVQPEGSHLIVTHSETGHHHVLDRKDAQMFENKDNDLEAFLVIHRESELKHLRSYDTHEPILLAPGQYKIRRQREYTAEGYRRVAD